MTILIAGGTGTLGTQIVRRLTARGLKVRVLTRDAERARHLDDGNVEIVPGDLRDARAVGRAVEGTQTVINSVQAGFGATLGSSPKTVDGQGSSNLLAAAKANGVQHLVLVSIYDVAPGHPLELWRMKYRGETELQASGLAWTIIRSTAFMEWAVTFVCQPLVENGKALVYGRGNNPINFVSAHDVAQFVELSVVDPAMRGELLTVAGPENLSFNQLAQTFKTVTGTAGQISHVPLPLMRFMAKLLVPLKPALAREIQAGVFLDTADRTTDGTAVRARYPSIPVTTLQEMIRRDYPAAKETDPILSTVGR
jgi:NADH dehydrogenase